MNGTNDFLCHIAGNVTKPGIQIQSNNTPPWVQAAGISWKCHGETVTAVQEGETVRLVLSDVSAGSRQIEWNRGTSQAILRRADLWSKPFYFYMGDGELVVSDSLRQIIRIMPVQPRICENALDTYLALEFFPAPITPFHEIYKVGVEETCLLNLSTKSKKWITGPLPERLFDSFEQAAKDVSEALQEVMSKHTRQDSDELVLLCSGGLDSTIMAHFMRGHGRAIVLSYVDSWKDEVMRARQTAEHARLPLQEIKLPDFGAEVFYEYAGLLDEPLGGTCSYAISHLCRAVQPGARIIGGHGSGALSFTNFQHRHLRDSLNSGPPETLEERFCSNVMYMDADMRKGLLESGSDVHVQNPVAAMLERELPFQKDRFHALHAIIRRQLCIAEETTQIWPVFEAFGHKPVIPLLEKAVYTAMDRFRESVLRNERYERRLLNEIARRHCTGYIPQPIQLGYGLPLGLAGYPNEYNMEEVVTAFSGGPVSDSGLYRLLDSSRKAETGKEKFYWLRRLWSAVLLNAWIKRNIVIHPDGP